MNTTIHPEALSAVNKKFRELHLKNPTTDGSVLWAMAKDFVFTMALTDRAIMRVELGI